MKKAAVILIAAILSVICLVPAFAADKREIGVFAKSVYTFSEGCYAAEEEDGGYTAELPEDVTVTVTLEVSDPTLRLVIVPITRQEAEAYRWLSERTADLGTNHLFFDIYFVDEYGARVSADTPAHVRISLPTEYGTPKTAEVSSGGEVTLLIGKNSGNSVSFSISGGGYYAIAMSKTGGLPQTGDASHVNIWLALLLVSATAMTAVLYVNKRQTR